VSYRKVILVTGCSSGIGFSLAQKLYHRNDLKVVITTRPESMSALKLSFQESERFLIRELDITNSSNIYKVVNEVCCRWGRIDVLINNAGICFRSVMEHMDDESELLQMNTNYLGPMTLIRSLLPVMREQRKGQIINISSVSGTLSMPTMGSYSASKHALEGASEALWYEGRPFGIRVHLVELGFINSASFKKVILTRKAKLSTTVRGPLSEYYASMIPFIEKMMGFTKASPEKVSRKILQLIDKPTHCLRLDFTLDAIFLSYLRKLLPSFLLIRMIYFILPGSVQWGGAWRVKGPI